MKSTTKETTTIYVDNVPSGTIVMWSKSEIPKGWHICDGKHDTPDLRNQFIVAASKDATTVLDKPIGPSPLNQQGGTNQIKLGVANMPNDWPTIHDPGHSHSGTTTGPTLRSTLVVGTGDTGTTGYASNHGDKAATFTTTVGGNSTSIDIPSKGQGQSITYLPPYYALYFIQKL